MKPGLQLRFSQHLALTPQLQQSIRLLQLSTLELQLEISQMLETNPFLELEEEDGLNTFEDAIVAPPASDLSPDSTGALDAAQANDTYDAADMDGLSAPDFSTATQDDWENSNEYDEFNSSRELPTIVSSASEDNDDHDGFSLNAQGISLSEHLFAQLAGMQLAPEDRFALEVLIHSVNEDGYLDDSLEAIAQQLLPSLPEQRSDTAYEDLHQRLHLALRWLQSMDPPGVGARNLSECLELQLLRMTANPERDLALLIARSHLDLLAKRDSKKLMALTLADAQTLQWAQSLIRQCTPRPGEPFTQNQPTTIVPDVLVQRHRQGFRVVINPEVMPRLRIQDAYAQAIRGQGRGGGSPLAGHLQEARWFIKNIQQRFDTIWRVSSAIVERQKNFFIHGELAMKPLVLREIADELDLHESTISRVTTAKYMATPMGTFELKYFFGSGLSTDAGNQASSTAVRALIKQLIAAENTRKPLSDSKLSDLLSDQGIQVARRTVAKYRESLKIAPANLRKAL